MDQYKNISNCRICRSDQIFQVLKFDDQYIASTFVKSNRDHPTSNVKIPLTLMLCKVCGLVQLQETVRPDLLFHNYFYRSGITDTMRTDLKDVVNNTMSLASIQPGDYVVDIGANDCTMISMFPDYLRRIAVEPAQNIHWDHLDKSIQVINDYFGRDLFASGYPRGKSKNNNSDCYVL